MSPTEAFALFSATLAGQPISHVWRGYGSALFIEIGGLTPRLRQDGSMGNPQGEVSLGVEWSWRVEDPKAILCGSWSDEGRWESSLSLIRDVRIVRCELFGVLPEVALTTETGVRFLSFSTTDGQPQWHLIDRRGDAPRWFTVQEGRLHLGDGAEPSI